ncbi:hypothetical protein BC629DRAFT_1435764 [Irpex lacteus]|nr:hypothetical protein BC629DRAFT_1435764 [Irpex lacteus]
MDSHSGSDWSMVFCPSGIYDSGASKLTYITPARWAFLIWPAIHFLLLGTLLYQFTENGCRIVVKAISWRFFVLMEANALYLYLWYSHLYSWAFCASTIVVSMLISIRGIMLENLRSTIVADQLFVWIPLSLYDGWMFTVQQTTVFAALGLDASIEAAGFWTLFFVCTTFMGMQPLALWLSMIQPAGGIAIAWYLWAVFDGQRSNELVHQWALVSAIFATIWVNIGLTSIGASIRDKMRRIEGGSNGERAPLVVYSSGKKYCNTHIWKVHL